MDLPPPDRLAYFPAVQIFGATIVPLYYTAFGPAIPLGEVAKALGISPQSAFRIVEKNRASLHLFDAAACEPVAEECELGPRRQQLCLGMHGITLLIMSLDVSRIADPRVRERIIIAKYWLAAQVANRIKPPGRKSQPRWDTGLNKHQSRELRKRISRLRDARAEKNHG